MQRPVLRSVRGITDDLIGMAELQCRVASGLCEGLSKSALG